jgi:hypothetical protein
MSSRPTTVKASRASKNTAPRRPSTVAPVESVRQSVLLSNRKLGAFLPRSLSAEITEDLPSDGEGANPTSGAVRMSPPAPFSPPGHLQPSQRSCNAVTRLAMQRSAPAPATAPTSTRKRHTPETSLLWLHPQRCTQRRPLKLVPVAQPAMHTVTTLLQPLHLWRRL